MKDLRWSLAGVNAMCEPVPARWDGWRVFRWMLEVTAALTVAGTFAFLALYWHELPGRVPLHFGPSGLADSWGGRSGLLVMPLIALALYALLTAATKFPQLANLPFHVDRRDPEVVRTLVHTLVTIKLVVVVTFAYIEWASIETARGRLGGLGRGFLPIVIASIGASLAVFLVQLRRCRRT